MVSVADLRLTSRLSDVGLRSDAVGRTREP